MLRFCLHLLLTLWLALLVAAAVQCHRPAPWKTLQEASAKAPARSLLDVMEQSVFRRNAVLELNEADVNRYLAGILTAKQTGLSGLQVRFESVALDFEPGICRVCLSWELAGNFKSTADLEFTIERKGDEFIIEPVKGHYGRLPLYRGMMGTLVPALERFSSALNEETRILFQMNQISFAKDRLVLDPRMAPAK